MRYPIARSLASKTRNGDIVEDGSSDELELELLISTGSRVMLTTNLWIEAGLVNGALGFIKSIVYRLGTAPPKRPTYVTVEFDNYFGIPFDDHHPKVVPIAPLQRGRTFQLQLTLAWALAIHKSQGLTLPKEIIDIGPKERAGLTFVAISPIKYLQGLRIMSPFTYDRYEKIKSGKQLSNRKEEEMRLRSLEHQ